jgi:hypothetical protein
VTFKSSLDILTFCLLVLSVIQKTNVLEFSKVTEPTDYTHTHTHTKIQTEMRERERERERESISLTYRVNSQ